jgi:putative peptidoglycan lipid II flippase
MSVHSRAIARNAAVVGGATLLSRVLGFLRDVIVAFALGAGPLADAFFVAFRVPNLLRRLFAEGSLTMAFVPVFTRVENEDGTDEAYVMARSVWVWLLIILLPLTLIALFFAEPLTTIIAPGFREDAAVFAATVDLVRICFPYIILVSGMALCMGVLNAKGHFLMPALGPVALNVVLIVSALSGAWFGMSVPYALAWGVLIAGVVQVLMQIPPLKARGFEWFGPVRLAHRGVVRTGKLMLPTVFGAAVYQINIVIGTILASFLAAGSISYLYYADRLVQFPLGIFGVAVSTAALPSLSAIAATGDMREFGDTLRSSLRLTMFISLPATAGLIALAEPLVSVLFGRGEFTPEAARATAWALIGYGAGLPAFALVRPLVSAFYALEDTRTPVLVAAASLLIYVATGLTLMWPLDHVGLALATTVSSWANGVMLAVLLRRRVAGFTIFIRQSLPSLGLSAVILAGALATLPLGPFSVALIPVWIVAYFGLALLFRLPEAMMVLTALKARLGKGRAGEDYSE